MNVMLIAAVALLVVFGFLPVIVKAGVDAVRKRADTTHQQEHTGAPNIPMRF